MKNQQITIRHAGTATSCSTSAGTATVKQSYALIAGPGIDPAEDPEIKGKVQVEAGGSTLMNLMEMGLKNRLHYRLYGEKGWVTGSVIL